MKYLVLPFLVLLVSPAIVPSLESSYVINYPVRFAYVDKLAYWWPPQKVAAGMGVPGYANSTLYNYIALGFWTYQSGPVDVASLWANPVKFFLNTSVFGATNDEIQKNLKKKYNDNNIKILISAFGSSELPTTAKIDALSCANKLADFVLGNNLDGVDIDYEDNSAMNAGNGQTWVITFQRQLRARLPNHIITHAPQAPYFKQENYKNGGYMSVHKTIGATIDFYNVQFYNQGTSTYDTYTTLFTTSNGWATKTSVKEIIARGVPAKKIVVGKPVLKTDAYNTGHMDLLALGNAISKAYTDIKWYGGVMLWQYSSDLSGVGIQRATSNLTNLCSQYRNCN